MEDYRTPQTHSQAVPVTLMTQPAACDPARFRRDGGPETGVSHRALGPVEPCHPRAVTRAAIRWSNRLAAGKSIPMSRRRIEDNDREAIGAFIERHWHSRIVMSRGRSYHPHEHEGFIEWRDDDIVGLLTMAYEDEALQVLTLNSMLEGERIGSALMLMAIEDARERDIDRIWLTTTNDNVRAFGFYQKLGFRLVQVNVGVVDEARKVKTPDPRNRPGRHPHPRRVGLRAPHQIPHLKPRRQCLMWNRLSSRSACAST